MSAGIAPEDQEPGAELGSRRWVPPHPEKIRSPLSYINFHHAKLNIHGCYEGAAPPFILLYLRPCQEPFPWTSFRPKLICSEFQDATCITILQLAEVVQTMLSDPIQCSI